MEVLYSQGIMRNRFSVLSLGRQALGPLGYSSRLRIRGGKLRSDLRRLRRLVSCYSSRDRRPLPSTCPSSAGFHELPPAPRLFERNLKPLRIHREGKFNARSQARRDPLQPLRIPPRSGLVQLVIRVRDAT